MRKTKIICTLGPASSEEPVIRQLMLSGMDVVRLNMSHGSYDEHRRKINIVKALREEFDSPTALLLDTKGPEIRLKSFADGSVILKEGQAFTLTGEDIVGDDTICAITYTKLAEDIKVGGRILLDDGLIALSVEKIEGLSILCRVLNGGKVSNNKGVNVPGCSFSMPYMSEKDKDDIKFAVEEDFDFIAASFVRSKEDVADIKQLLDELGGNDIRIISKIENAQGIENIDEIIRASDGIMIARGDMGVEIELEEIPRIQKELIKKTYVAGKQVVTATQMLESMVENPRPTRAEVTDVANAVYDGTSAIMLSGETAAGKYPVEAVKTMASIAAHTERNINFVSRMNNATNNNITDITSAISHATCSTAHDLGAVAILTASKTGRTARLISRFRPACNIICGCTDIKVRRQLNLAWGVTPLMISEMDTTDQLFKTVAVAAEKAGLVESGDLTVITAGIPLGVSGTTNMLKVHLVGDILVEGVSANPGNVAGRLCVCDSEEQLSANFIDGDILVIRKTSNAIMPILRKASGIITESSGLNSHAAIAGMALNIPVLIGVSHATELLHSGTMVTLDANRGVVLSLR